MTRRFLIAFFIGLILFIGINLLSAHLASDCGLVAVFEQDSCSDDIARAGWPLRFYEEGGIEYHRMMSVGTLGLDILFGVVVSGIMGWLVARRIK
jgi:ABC-type antimicrobial peptide transport system permease subunit